MLLLGRKDGRLHCLPSAQSPMGKTDQMRIAAAESGVYLAVRLTLAPETLERPEITLDCLFLC
jgi:hypothetical protein